MVRVSSPAKLRRWSELTAKMVMGVVPGLVIFVKSATLFNLKGPAMEFPESGRTRKNQNTPENSQKVGRSSFDALHSHREVL